MAGQLLKRGPNTYLCRVFIERDASGKRIYDSKTVHGTKRDAQEELAKMLLDRSRGAAAYRAKRTTMNELFEDLVRDYRINGKREDWCESVVRVHLRPYFAKMRVGRVTTSTARAYVDERQSEGAANATINRELALLRRSLYLGHHAGLVPVVPRIELLAENNVRQGFLEDAEYRALLRELPEYLKPMVAYAYYTGCRRGELLRLKWTSVDLVEGVVRLEPRTTKNKEPRMIALNPELLELFAFAKAKRDREFPSCEAVFYGEKGKPIRDFKDAWKYACFRAGLWTGGKIKEGRPTRTFHDLRRTGVRNNVRAGVPEKVAQEISGHKTRAVFERYNIVNERDLKEAARRQYDYIQKQRAAADGTQAESGRHTVGTQGPQKGSGDRVN